MTNTWLEDLIRETNERFFNDDELDRLTAYYSSLPERIQASGELERLEARLAESFPTEVIFSMSPGGSRRLALDFLECLRPLALSVLADDPILFRRRWLDQLPRLIEATKISVDEVARCCQRLREHLAGALSPHSGMLIFPLFAELTHRVEQLDAPRPLRENPHDQPNLAGNRSSLPRLP